MSESFFTVHFEPGSIRIETPEGQSIELLPEKVRGLIGGPVEHLPNMTLYFEPAAVTIVPPRELHLILSLPERPVTLFPRDRLMFSHAHHSLDDLLPPTDNSYSSTDEADCRIGKQVLESFLSIFRKNQATNLPEKSAEEQGD